MDKYAKEIATPVIYAIQRTVILQKMDVNVLQLKFQEI